MQVIYGWLTKDYTSVGFIQLVFFLKANTFFKG